MAKKSGLVFKTEEEFRKEYQPERMSPGSFKQVVEQLRANNLSAKSISPDSIKAKSLDAEPVIKDSKEAQILSAKSISADSIKAKSLDAEPVIKDSKEAQIKREELKNDEELLQSNKRLNTNLEKLTQTIKTKGGMTNEKAEKLAGEQKLDYRSLGQQMKDRIGGRGTNKFDPHGAAWKFGSVRGLLHTTGLVQGGTGGFLDNKLAVREERMRTAHEMTKANSTMKNLPQFHDEFGNPSDALVEDYYNKRGKKVQAAKANLQTQQYNIDTAQALMSEEEYARTTGGKKQLKARNEAAQALIDIDPTKQGEKKGAFSIAKSGEDIQDKLNVSQEESDTLKALEDSTRPLDELITITKVENERKTKADADMLAALNNVAAAAGEGGSLGGLANAATDLIGKKGANAATDLIGKKGAIGAAKKGAGYLSKVGGAGKLMKGLGIGAVGALAGEGLQYGGEKLQEAGYEKTGKAVGTAGTAAKYAGYGAMIGSVIPGVGTVIGGAIGGVIGAGKGVYDNYFANDSKKPVTSITSKEQHSLRMDTSDPNNPKYLVDGKQISAKEYERLQNIDDPIDQAEAIAAASNKADQISARSAENAAAKLPTNTAPSNTIVNAPTNISKSSTNNSIKVPVRDQDHSVRKYYNSRYAT